MRHASRVLTVTVTGAAIALFGSRASAAPTPGAQFACQAEVATLCKGVQPGGGRIYVCLRDHSDKLSPECKKELDAKVSAHRSRQATAAAGGGAKPASGPCLADIEKLCKGVPAGGGRIMECLAQHKSEISDECKMMMDSRQKK